MPNYWKIFVLLTLYAARDLHSLVVLVLLFASYSMLRVGRTASKKHTSQFCSFNAHTHKLKKCCSHASLGLVLDVAIEATNTLHVSKFVFALLAVPVAAEIFQNRQGPVLPLGEGNVVFDKQRWQRCLVWQCHIRINWLADLVWSRLWFSTGFKRFDGKCICGRTCAGVEQRMVLALLIAECLTLTSKRCLGQILCWCFFAAAQVLSRWYTLLTLGPWL